MKSFQFHIDQTRNLEREELFVLTIVERVLAGFIQNISIIDQANFCEILQQRQKKRMNIQPLHLEILKIIKQNIFKGSKPVKDEDVKYEIRAVTSSSSSIDKRKQNLIPSYKKINQEQQTTELNYKKGQISLKNIREFQQDNNNITKNQDNESLKEIQFKEFNNKQLNSPNSTTIANNSNTTKQIQIQIEEKSEEDNKELNKKEQGNNNLIQPNQIAIINIVSQDGQIEQQEDFIINKKEQNQYTSIVQQPYLEQHLQDDKNKDNINVKNPFFSQRSSSNTSNHQTSTLRINNKLINNEELGTIRDQENEQQQNKFNQQSTQKERSYIQEFNKKTNDIQSEIQNDNNSKYQVLKSTKKQISLNNNEIIQKQGSNEDSEFQEQNSSKQLSGPKISVDNDQPQGNFLTPPISSRSLMYNRQGNIFKYKTLQSNDDKLNQFGSQGSQEEFQKNQDSLSSQDQSGIQSKSNIRPSTTFQEQKKQSDFLKFQSHDDLNSQTKVNNQLLQQQTSITSIMHDEENFGTQNSVHHGLNQQFSIQINECDNLKKPSNNIIIEESIEGSPQLKQHNLYPQISSHLSIQKSDNQNQSQNSFQQPSKQTILWQQQPSQTIISPSQTNISVSPGSQQQSRMLIPINKITSSNKNVRNQNKSKSQIKEIIQQQKSEDSQPESKLTIESSQGDKSNRQKVSKSKQLKLPAATVALNFARRKSSQQISPIDPKKLEQQEKERQKQLEYQKQLEKLKYERELIEQYKIPDNMPLSQKKAIIEQLISQLENNNPDQDVKYQIMLYKQRQEQLVNAQKLEINFEQYQNSCYEELDHVAEQKLKVFSKEADPNKVHFLKFEEQIQTNFPGQSKSYIQELNSPIKRNYKYLSNLDPVEIERQINRKFEFKQETEMLKFFQSFTSNYDKEIYQCDLDYPTTLDVYQNNDCIKGILPKVNQKRRKLKQATMKITMNTFRIDPKKLNKVVRRAEKIKQIGQFLL